MNQYTLPLSDPQADLAHAGGKGASLVRLSAAGLPVPDGFHLITTAYEQFVAQNQLRPFIIDTIHAVDPSQPEALQTASNAIQASFAQSTMPPDIAAAITNAYQQLPGQNPAVAVRSSATAEDLPHLSLASRTPYFI